MSAADGFGDLTYAAVEWSGADGGFVKMDGPTAEGYFTAGTGEGSMYWWPPSVGTWTFSLTSSKGKRAKVLAKTTVEVGA